MKRFFSTAVVLLLIAGTVVDAATLNRRQFRKFHGRYVGNVSGIAGNASLRSEPVAGRARIIVTSRRSELLVPLLPIFFERPRHRILWRQPVGNARRATLVGLYRGNYTNPAGVPMRVSGTRRLVLRDRGPAFRQLRFATGFSDNLTESFAVTGQTSASQNLNGLLRK